MSWVSDLFTGSVSSFVESIGNVADRFIETPEDKAQFAIELERLLQKRDSEIEQTIRTELQAKERMLVAELSQDDNYTKRARPTVVYVGLGFIFLIYVAFPLIALLANAKAEPLADLPAEFWMAWGGICSSWVIGRSMEKRGVRHPVVNAVTGTKPTKLLD